MALDFVYGDVKAGVLRPLDGQQRLTTLFLLHWYVASMRRGARPRGAVASVLLCDATDRARLLRVARRTPLSGWIRLAGGVDHDQPWYVYPWRQDPTISSMLVMLDAIHERFDHEHTDFAAVWARLENRTEAGDLVPLPARR